MEKIRKRVKYSDIVRTMSMILTEHFPDIPIMNVLKDHPRASFFTRLDVENTGAFMTRHIDSDIAFRIYYYPSTSEKSAEYELLEMRDELEYLFLVELNRLITIDELVNIEVLDIGVGEVDEVLHFYVFMTVSQEIYDDSEHVITLDNIYHDEKVYNTHPADFQENKKGSEIKNGE